MKIKISGVIGWETTAENIRDQLDSSSGDIDVVIDSEGGYIYEGVQIYNMLSDYEGKVNIKITSLAASISSYIAMAGDTVEVYDNATFMIHNGWMVIGGDHNEMRKGADHLEALSSMLAQKYSEVTGIDIEEIQSMMDEETYFYGSEIQERGFATSVKTTKNESNKLSALALAKEKFKACEAKVKSEEGDDMEKVAALMKGHMKQFENKPKNSTKEEDMALKELMARLDALEAKAKLTKDEEGELAKVRADIQTEKDAEIATLKAEKAELQRSNEIAQIAKKYDVPEALAKEYEEKGTADDFVRAILDSKKETAVAPHEKPEARKDMIFAMADAIAIRSGAKVSKPHENARKYANASLLAIARELTNSDNFVPAAEVASKALAMGSSDFPILLSNVANKILESYWEEEPTTYQNWVGEADVNDFKENTFAHLGGFGNLKPLYERGELKKGTVKESKEVGKIGTKGLIVSLSREAIINDDLGGFTRMVESLAQSARRTLNADVYSTLQSTSYKMGDNKIIFHADHKNAASTGSEISQGALTAGELAMSNQVGLNGEKLNLSPFFLLTGAAQYRPALQVLGDTSVPGTDNNSGTVNTWKGGLEAIKDSNISGNAWYLASKNNTVKVMFLAGTGRKPIIEETDRNAYKGIEYTIVFDYGIMVDNYRTLYKNAGQ